MKRRKSPQSTAMVLFVLLAFALLRGALGHSIIYDALEPILAPLDNVANTIYNINSPQIEGDEYANIESNQLKQENDELKRQLELQSANDTAKTAQIMRRDLLGFDKRVWLGIGSNDGIEKGSAVMANGALFGYVEGVYDSRSEVVVVNDPSFKATVRVGATLHGLYRVEHGSVVVDLLPERGLEDKKVVTDGLDGKFPEGIIVGSIGNEFGQAFESLGKYGLKQPFNPFDVTYVQVVGVQ